MDEKMMLAFELDARVKSSPAAAQEKGQRSPSAGFEDLLGSHRSPARADAGKQSPQTLATLQNQYKQAPPTLAPALQLHAPPPLSSSPSPRNFVDPGASPLGPFSPGSDQPPRTPTSPLGCVVDVFATFAAPDASVAARLASLKEASAPPGAGGSSPVTAHDPDVPLNPSFDAPNGAVDDLNPRSSRSHRKPVAVPGLCADLSDLSSASFAAIVRQKQTQPPPPPQQRLWTRPRRRPGSSEPWLQGPNFFAAACAGGVPFAYVRTPPEQAGHDAGEQQKGGGAPAPMAAFYGSLGLAPTKRRRTKRLPARPAPPALQVTAPDGHSYDGTLSFAAVNALKAAWKDTCEVFVQAKPAADASAKRGDGGAAPAVCSSRMAAALWEGEEGRLSPELARLVGDWDTRCLRGKRAGRLARPFPGDDVCENPVFTCVDWTAEKISNAEQRMSVAIDRLQDLTDRQNAAAEGAASPQDGSMGTSWLQQEVEAGKWRIKEIEKEIRGLLERKDEAETRGESPGADGPPPGVDPAAEPRSVDVIGAMQDTCNGVYRRLADARLAYENADGWLLYRDGKKWGFVEPRTDGTHRCVAISLRSGHTNPAAVRRWFEADIAKPYLFVQNRGLTVKPSEVSPQDAVETLVAMGFSRDTATDALSRSKFSIPHALDFLLAKPPGTPLQTPLKPKPKGKLSTPITPPKPSSSSTKPRPHHLTQPAVPSAGSSQPARGVVAGGKEAVVRMREALQAPEKGSYPGVVEGLKMMFDTIDSAVIAGIAQDFRGDEEACIMELSRLAHQGSAAPSQAAGRRGRSRLSGSVDEQPLSATSSTSSLTPLTPVPSQSDLPKFRILPANGIAYRLRPKLSEVETRIAGPRQGDIVSVVRETSEWVQVENQYWLPLKKKGDTLLERVNVADEEALRRFGCLVREVAKEAADLHCALRGGRVKLARLLLEAGCRPDVADAQGNSPLAMIEAHPAFDETNGDTLFVVSQLAADGRAQAKDACGRTALQRAAAAAKGGLVSMLLGCGADPNHADSQGKTALCHALDAPQPPEGAAWAEAVAALATEKALNRLQSDGSTLLTAAIASGNVPRASLLLSLGASPQGRTRAGVLPLFACLRSAAFAEKHADAAAQTVFKAVAVPELAAGADTAAGMPPLVAACAAFAPPFVALLLNAGASPTLRAADGLSPLGAASLHVWPQYAAQTFRRLAVPELLGPDTQAEGKEPPAILNCMTPSKAHMAAAILAACETAVLAVGPSKKNVLHTAAQEADGPSNEAWVQLISGICGGAFGAKLLKELDGASGDSPLHVAVKCCNDTLSNIFLDNGAQPGLQNTAGQSAMHVACSLSHYDEPAAKDVLEKLFAAGKADLAATDGEGFTCLHRCVSLSLWRVAAALLDAGADPNAPDTKGRLAYHFVLSLPPDRAAPPAVASRLASSSALAEQLFNEVF
ncbi:hypothetical protein DIPPA_25618 [Diplonema papillatum]|nr:hypothetical protein DIPPA_25618 [Diplonema papillatum]